MARKIIYFVIVVVLLMVCGYLYLRYNVLKSSDFRPDNSKAKTATDLRPALIAKMKQLVKDGSDGLYVLNIRQVEPSVANAEVDFFDVAITPDTAVLARLHQMRKAPDDVFKISFKTLHISGVGLSDLLQTQNIKLLSVIVDQPRIEVFHEERTYNADKRLANDTLTVYEKVAKHFKSVAIENISVKNAQIISNNKRSNKTNRFNNVSIHLKELVVDSATQYDDNRFLFAKTANISSGKYSVPTPDSLYFFSCGSIDVSADKNRLTVTNVELNPRLSKEAFQQKSSRRNDRYTIKIPKIVLSDVDWWKLANNQKLIAKQADVYNGQVDDYLDMRKPPKPFKADNYPQQAIMKLKMPLAVNKVKFHNMSVSYEEVGALSDKRATVYFDRINGEMNNVTNLTGNRNMTFKANALFMKKVPVSVAFNFNLAKHKTGNFTADIKMAAMEFTTLNMLAEPLGLFSIKKGNIKEATAHMQGDNFKVNGDLILKYDDLTIIPLKKDDESGALKKKRIVGALANAILIKDANPDKKGLRRERYVVMREQHPNFFNQLWKTLLTGILKTIGAPSQLAK